MFGLTRLAREVYDYMLLSPCITQNQLYQGYNLTACVHWYVDYTRRRIWYSLYRNEYMHRMRTNTVEFNSDYVVSIKHFRNFLS